MRKIIVRKVQQLSVVKTHARRRGPDNVTATPMHGRHTAGRAGCVFGYETAAASWRAACIVGSMTIFERLRADHDVQRTLMRLLLKTHGDSRGRNELFQRLKRAVETHAEAEERAFYARLLGSELGREQAANSVREHGQVRDLFSELEQQDMSSSAWLGKAQTLVDLSEHHMQKEEREIFEVARKVLTKTEQESLVDDFNAYADKAAE